MIDGTDMKPQEQMPQIVKVQTLRMQDMVQCKDRGVCDGEDEGAVKNSTS